MTAALDVVAGIPALPVSVAKVLEETSKDDPDPRVLTRAIETDVSLAAKILSVVNSPYYGLPGTVTGVGQAVTVVGMRQVRNVALAVGAVRAIPGIPSSIIDPFLERAMATAKTARSIATKGGLGSAMAEAAHVGGLLWGVGALVALRMGDGRPSDAEIVRLAKLVLEHWRLPEPIVAAVTDSDGPFKGDPTSAFAIHAATLAVRGRSAKCDPNVLAALKLTPAALDAHVAASK